MVVHQDPAGAQAAAVAIAVHVTHAQRSVRRGQVSVDGRHLRDRVLVHVLRMAQVLQAHVVQVQDQDRIARDKKGRSESGLF